MLTMNDIFEYAEVQGNRRAADLLLLVGPDGYDGDNYDELMELLEEQEYRSAYAGDYSPSCPWNAPGMSVHDFI